MQNLIQMGSFFFSLLTHTSVNVYTQMFLEYILELQKLVILAFTKFFTPQGSMSDAFINS